MIILRRFASPPITADASVLTSACHARALSSSVTSVLIAVADVGAGLALESALREAGLRAQWRAELADGPTATAGAADAIIVDADYLGERLEGVCHSWRTLPSVPAVVAVGDGEQARAFAPAARVTLLAGRASAATLVAQLEQARRLRHAGALAWSVLCAALRLPDAALTVDALGHAASEARAVDLDIPRVALSAYARCYVTATPLLEDAVRSRALPLPEQQLAKACDGTTTLQTLIGRGPLSQASAARLLWVFACAGAVDLTSEVRDMSTTPRRALAELRLHLRHRQERLAGSTYYDVLEVSPCADAPDFDEAVSRQAFRYAPEALAAHDLADLAGVARPLWDLVERARATLRDPASRGRYHDWLRARPALRSTWAVDPERARQASLAFARGQAALGDSDIHRAVGELAAACRLMPGHPEHEATLAWARFRAQTSAGHDRALLAKKERSFVEALLVGRRPWPRAEVALALLCTADGDLPAARWHLAQALAVEPTLPGAAALRERLGVG